MSKYIPETGPKVIPERIEEKTVTGLLNPLPVGTPIRATLGETVIVGKVGRPSPEFAIVTVDIKPRRSSDYPGLLEGHNLWVEDGWEFEVLGEVAA